MSEKVKLGDICNILNGYAFKSKNYVDKGIRVIRITNVQKGIIEDVDPKYYDISEIDNLKNYMLKENDLLISLTGNVGRVGLMIKKLLPAGLNQRVGCLRIKDDRNLSTRYLYQCLNNNKFETECINNSNGIAQKNLSTEWLKNYIIPVPNIEIQQQIAGKLEKIQKIIEIKRQQIKAFDELIKSQFVEMFGDIVNNDKKWKQIRLEDISEIKSGGTPTRSNPEFFKGTIPWITTISLGKNVIDEYDAVEFITEEAINKSATKLVEKESLLFGIRVGVGKISMNKVPMCMNQDIVAITNINSRFRKLFLKKAIEEYSEYFNNQKRGATIQGITSNILKKIKLPVIELELQDKYLTFLNQMDKQKFEIENSLKDMQELYESLMEKYFG